MQKPYLEAGKIVSTHGIKGEVKIDPWCDSPEFLADFTRLYIDGKALNLKSIRIHKNQCIALFDGISDINSAMAITGSIVSIDREEAVLPDGSYFIEDIIGFEVYDEAIGLIGKLSEVLKMPAHDVYVVSGDTEHLIPVAKDFIKNVDTGLRRIDVRLIPGM